MKQTPVFTEEMKQVVSQLNSSSQIHIVNGLADGKVSPEMVVKIATFAKSLPDGMQQITVSRVIGGSIVLE